MKNFLMSALIVSSLIPLIGCSPKSTKDPLPVEDLTGPKGDRHDQNDGELTIVENWITKDITLDGVAGTSADRAYTLSFAKPNVSPVIVAIIDSGVDIFHEDLKASIWENAAEANGQLGVDDDHNGYIDDINGWDYLGSYDAKGSPTFIRQERLEVTRETVRMKELKAAREAQGQTLTSNEQVYFDQVTKDFADRYKVNADLLKLNTDLKTQAELLVSKVSSLSQKVFATITLKDIETAAVTSVDEDSAKSDLLKIFTDNKLKSINSLLGRIDYYDTQIKYYLNESFNPRKDIVGDDLSDFSDIKYGNNVVEGPRNSDGIAEDSSHGTHVAGIIGATRGNSIGIEGIARDVRFIALRAVPDGDENDKDIANAIRYATDNGAKIINMSFGKGYSPYKAQVDAAFQYAASKGVLLVHAAGNDNADNDKGGNFPNRYLFSNPLQTIKGWLEIGASSAKVGEDLVASFSNFGKISVDIFAPGVSVVSSVPGDKYDSYSGTSMASPSTAGVAALVWSQFPTLTAEELKTIITESVVDYSSTPVKVPGTDDIVLFGSLSRTGGIANAYNAMIKACEYTGGKNCQ